VLGQQLCTFKITGDQHIYEDLVMVARASSLVSDILALGLTCMKTLRKGGPVILPINSRTSLSDVLLKDTAFCFGLLCIITVIGIGTSRLTEFIEVWATWTCILTSVLLSRLALDLREAGSELYTDSSLGHEMISSTMRFGSYSTAVGSSNDARSDIEDTTNPSG